MAKYLLLLSAFIGSFGLFAQSTYLPGYIIKLSGDTLKGEIFNQVNMSKSCQFRMNDITTTYSPDDIAGYGITDENRLFESNNVKIEGTDQRVFLEYLVDGIVDLYMLNTGYYFLKKDGQFLLLESREKTVYQNDVAYVQHQELYKGTLNYAFSDALPINTISSTNLNFKSLSRITKRYHDKVCDWECEIYRKSTKGTVELLPSYSLYQSKVFLTIGPDSDYTTTSRFGAMIAFTSAKSTFFSFITGLELTQSEFAGNFIRKINYYYAPEDSIAISHTKLAIPVLIKWNLFQFDKVGFCAIGGIRNYIVTDGDYEIRYKFGNTTSLNYRKYHAGLTLGLGLTYKFSDKIGLLLQPYYEYELPTTTLGAYFDYIRFSNMGVSTGLIINL